MSTATRLPSRRREPTPRLTLSKREKDVLRAMLIHDRDEDVAKELSISRSAVRQHIGNLYARFGVNSKHRLLVACLKIVQPN